MAKDETGEPRIKVLHILPSWSQGGAEMVCDYVIRMTDHEHTLMTFMDVPRMGTPPPCRELDFSSSVKARSPWLVKRAKAATTAVRMALAARAIKPDIVIGWLYPSFLPSLLVANACKASVIWSTHAGDLVGTQHEAGWGELHKVARFSTHVAAMHFTSEGSRRWHASQGFTAPPYIISNGVEAERFVPTEPHRRSRPRFLVPARFSYEKGHKTIAEVMRNHPDLDVVLAGRDTDSDECRDLIPNATGLGQRTDMAALYADCDAVVLASDFENQPLVVMEALAAGRPVVSTNVGNAADVIGDLGVIVPPKDPAALGAALVGFDRQLIEKAFAKGPDRIRDNWSAQAMADNWSKMIKAVARQRTAGTAPKGLQARLRTWVRARAAAAVPPLNVWIMCLVSYGLYLGLSTVAGIFPTGFVRAKIEFVAFIMHAFSLWPMLAHVYFSVVGGVVDKVIELVRGY